MLKTRTNDNVVALMCRLGDEQFWGNVSLKFQRGRVIHITKEESIQPEQLEPENRTYDAVNGTH